MTAELVRSEWSPSFLWTNAAGLRVLAPRFSKERPVTVTPASLMILLFDRVARVRDVDPVETVYGGKQRPGASRLGTRRASSTPYILRGPVAASRLLGEEDLQHGTMIRTLVAGLGE
jgi:hypothetical protein